VLDSTTNYIEHPELVAQRLVRYARLVGRENVIAGTDCGFATFASYLAVDPAIAWVKLHAMAEGAGSPRQSCGNCRPVSRQREIHRGAFARPAHGCYDGNSARSF
jgi:5-methyltetrahydropteroyltriglutamate--homocysteine methyltransferase